VRLREPNWAIYIEKEEANLVVPSLMAIVRPNNNINNHYLAHYINSKLAQKKLKKSVKGTTIPMLQSRDLANLEVILPPTHKQAQIVKLISLADEEIQLLETLKTRKHQLKNELLDHFLKQEIE
jgi:restriction endonuclease S subunit